MDVVLFRRRRVWMKRFTARWSMKVVAMSVALVMSSGCYTYTPVPVASAPIGADVRVVMTRQGAAQLISVMDIEGAALTVVGRLDGREGGSLVLRVPQPVVSRTAPRLEQIVRVPVSEVLSLELQSYSQARTGLLLGSTAGLAVLLVLKIIDAGFGAEDEDPDVELSINVLRFPFR